MLKSKNSFLCMVFMSLIVVGCSANIIKKRLLPPYKVSGGILFQYDAPSARQVNLAGNFPDNEWLKQGDRIDIMNDNGINGDKIADDGIWSIIKSLSPGRYEYKFVIDRNTWVEDPNALDRVEDGYGGVNSVLIVK
tara:strand:+ start:559 stop:966 length:408 start_codon:yes stop_codon:yes gene_type:complete